MRDEVLTYLNSLKLKGITLSQELPFDANGVPLFTKNPKKIYVDQEQVTTEPFISVMSGRNINLETTVVVAYFSTDAKQLPAEYNSTLAYLRNTNAMDADNQYYRRQSNVTTEFRNDLLITSVELQFALIKPTL